MKDRLGWSAVWNQPLRNETQNVYRRFQRVPWGEMRSAFKDSQDSFQRALKRDRPKLEEYADD